jgi:MbtH protein
MEILDTSNAMKYDVVKNDEGQFSIWPAGKAIPAGWIAVGVTDAKAACLDYVKATWTDSRPKSLVERMDARSPHR